MPSVLSSIIFIEYVADGGMFVCKGQPAQSMMLPVPENIAPSSEDMALS